MHQAEADDRVTRCLGLVTVARAWPHARSISCGVDAFRPDVLRALYEGVAAAGAALPSEAIAWSDAVGSDRIHAAWIRADGRGVLMLSRECGFMPGVGEEQTAFALADGALVEGECRWEDNVADPTTVTFAVRAPSPDALERAAAAVAAVLDAFGHAPAVAT
ncbi:MAG: hypothetical protein U0324_31390 [Polyangiales bacterium]